VSLCPFTALQDFLPAPLDTGQSWPCRGPWLPLAPASTESFSWKVEESAHWIQLPKDTVWGRLLAEAW